jgi:hypothetical protein
VGDGRRPGAEMACALGRRADDGEEDVMEPLAKLQSLRTGDAQMHECGVDGNRVPGEGVGPDEI